MELTAADQARVKSQHAARTLRATLGMGVVWATLIAYKVGADESTHTWFGFSQAVWAPVIGIAMLGGLIGFALNLRCPHCSKSYGRPWVTKFCSSCGVALK